MPLPQPNLGVVGLGSAGDPELQDGDHLRWAFRYNLGFPAYGFSIYRRACDDEARRCLNLCSARVERRTDNGAHSVLIDGVLFQADPNRPQDVIVVGGGSSSSPATLATIPTGCSVALPAVQGLVVTLPGPVVAVSIDVEGDSFAVTAFSGALQVSTTMLKMGAGAQQITVDTGAFQSGSLFPTTFDRLVIDASKARITSFCLIAPGAAFGGLAQWQGPLNAESLAMTTNLGAMLGRLPVGQRPAYKKTLASLIPTIHSLLAPSPIPYAERIISYNNSAPPSPGSPSEDAKAQFAPRSLDLLLLMAIDPYVARALGLLFVDDQVLELGKPYDYLVTAHYSAPGALDYGAIAWSIVYGPTPALDPPTGLVAASVAGGTRQAADGSVIPSTSAGGLRWTLPLSGGALMMGAASAYDVARAALPGVTPVPPPLPASPAAFARITKLPVVVGRSDDGMGNLVYPDHYYLDFSDGTQPLKGWYAYEIRGVDIFGRRSAYSSPARVRLLQRVPPPPPSSVQARYIVHGDPLLSAGAAALVPNPGEERLVVSFTWTKALATQAPHIVHFTVYHQEAFPPPVEGNVLAAIDNHNGTFTVLTDLTIPAPAIYVDGSLLSGANPLSDPVHEAQANSFFALAATAGANAKLRVLPRITSTDVLTPKAGQRCRLSVGTANRGVWKMPPIVVVPAKPGTGVGSYAPDLSGMFTLPLPPGVFKAGAYIGVSSTVQVEASSELLEGAVSAPHRVIAYRRTPPPPPFVDISQLVSGSVDFYGNSLFPVTFTPQAGITYQIARALDETVAAAAGMSVEAFGALNNTDKRAKASAHPEAFALRNSAPAADSPYLDSLPGRSRSLFFYRVRSVDPVGNHGPWSEATPPVRAPHTTPPAPPVLKSAFSPANRQIELTWLPSREPEILEYRIYRTLDAAGPTDIRLTGSFPLVGSVTADPGQLAAHKVTYLDKAVRGGIAYGYRIAVAQSGDGGENVSDLSNLVVIRAQDSAPPAPPPITGVLRTTSPKSIAITWSLPPGDEDLRVLVQRRLQGTSLWSTLKVGTTLGTRLPEGATMYKDDDASLDLSKTYEYRLNAINTAGNTVFSAVKVTGP